MEEKAGALKRLCRQPIAILLIAFNIAAMVYLVPLLQKTAVERKAFEARLKSVEDVMAAEKANVEKLERERNLLFENDAYLVEKEARSLGYVRPGEEVILKEPVARE